MPLVKSIIELGIQSLQDPNNPASISAAAQEWSNFIFLHATGGLAGVTIPTFPGYPAALKASFEGSMKSMKFLQQLGTNLQPMWQSAIWAGPSFTGVTTVAIGTTLDIVMESLADRITKGEASFPDIATEIDTWSKTIMVTVTNIITGVPLVLPVT